MNMYPECIPAASHTYPTWDTHLPCCIRVSEVALKSRLGGVSEQAGGGAEVGEDDLAGPA